MPPYFPPNSLCQRGTLHALGLTLLGGWLSFGCQSETDVPSPSDTDTGVDASGGGGNSHPDEPKSTPAAAVARLLTQQEYQNTVEDLLGTKLNVTLDFPPEPVVNGFSNNARSHQINPLLLEQYQQAATTLAAEAKNQNFSFLAPCTMDATTDERGCDLERLLELSYLAFRRPPTSDELELLTKLYDQVQTVMGHEDALAAALESLLASPQFLYRVEAPPSPVLEDSITLAPFALASRLSYFLTGSMPDATLFSAAKDESLLDSVVVEEQARRLLDTDRARLQVATFHRQWLKLDRLTSIARDEVASTYQSSQLESVSLFLDSIFWSDTSSVFELYSSDSIYVNDELAGLYGLEAPTYGFAEVHEPGRRFGLLTQPALLTLFAHPNQSAPIKRGVFVRETLLCQEVHAPPPTVNNNPPDPDPNLTTRERFAVHTEDAVCAECHALIDPIGFGFEAYDQLGRYREEENSIAVDSSGELKGFPEEALNGPIAGVGDMSALIADSTTALDCLARNWLTFALGRAIGAGDQPDIERAVEQARDAGSSMRELIVALSVSDVFLTRAPHDQDGSP